MLRNSYSGNFLPTFPSTPGSLPVYHLPIQHNWAPFKDEYKNKQSPATEQYSSLGTFSISSLLSSKEESSNVKELENRHQTGHITAKSIANEISDKPFARPSSDVQPMIAQGKSPTKIQDSSHHGKRLNW